MTGTTTEVARECVSIRGALVVQPANESTTGVLTEATRYASMEAYTQVGHDGWNLPMPGDALSPGTVSWASSPVWCSSQPGIGDDNPVVPNELTGVRLARAVMAELQNTSSIVVRHAILGCCAPAWELPDTSDHPQPRVQLVSVIVHSLNFLDA